MPATTYRDRKAFSIENGELKLIVSVEGGHIASIADKAGVNPLWSPPWPSIEPSQYDRAKHPGYGADSESKLLSGILGHNLCLDLFGGPSDEEARAGMTVHGEASIARYEIHGDSASLTAACQMPIAGLRFERRIGLRGRVALISETVENLTASDRPVAWTQHATLGPPFLEPGKTLFRASATRGKVIESDFTNGEGYQKIAAIFDWPNVPMTTGGMYDLRVYPGMAKSGGYTTQLMDPHRDQAFFHAWSPSSKVLFGYVWKRSDFPWLGIWEENHLRKQAPWNAQTLTRGMEFGVSPFPEPRRQMIDRGTLFGVPGYRWIPAKSKVSVEYCAFHVSVPQIPESVEWLGEDRLRFS